MPSRNAFSGLEALLDTVPSRAGAGKGEPAPAGPPPAPGNPPLGPAAPAPATPPPAPTAPVPADPSAAAEKPAPAEPPATAAPARPSRPPASPASRPPRRAAPAPAGPAAQTSEPPAAATRTATTAAVPRPRPFSVKLPADLLDRARDAAYWVPGVTLTGMILEGLGAVIEQLEREHNGGKPFPARHGPVRTGRPLGR